MSCATISDHLVVYGEKPRVQSRRSKQYIYAKQCCKDRCEKDDSAVQEEGGCLCKGNRSAKLQQKSTDQKMNCLLLCLFLAITVNVVMGQIYLSTCARMDTPILDKAARAACITSCSIQNCGTGYCENRGGRKTCVCSRCANGGNVPLEELIKKKGRK
ncbi:hypothetical protein TELCIR_13263 [Teladorsagia circumcincta]|uniref:Uncharacterized protein n=1 Tax=Teladorsagia circumcincta TaxID=45464 RepID=A0A2G9U4C0_TELCI|nr:hypothetical protein TELCIR_13263 [Teladorsagia circumcincta]